MLFASFSFSAGLPSPFSRGSHYLGQVLAGLSKLDSEQNNKLYLVSFSRNKPYGATKSNQYRPFSHRENYWISYSHNLYKFKRQSATSPSPSSMPQSDRAYLPPPSPTQLSANATQMSYQDSQKGVILKFKFYLNLNDKSIYKCSAKTSKTLKT